jgi:hypothetical protein
MLKIAMIPLSSMRGLSRSVIRTGRGIVGSLGDDYLCGHCGSLILEKFNRSTVHGDPVYLCGFCDNLNEIPRIGVTRIVRLSGFKREET